LEYIYASLLLHTAKKEINEENLRKVLEAAGIAVDEVRVRALVAALKEINIDEIIRTAVSAPIVAAPVTPQAPTPATSAQPQTAATKEEEKKEEEERKELSEEQLAEGLSALFG